jgi:hypothetical protein
MRVNSPRICPVYFTGAPGNVQAMRREASKLFLPRKDCRGQVRVLLDRRVPGWRPAPGAGSLVELIERLKPGRGLARLGSGPVACRALPTA